jgi:hypothetical protein
MSTITTPTQTKKDRIVSNKKPSSFQKSKLYITLIKLIIKFRKIRMYVILPFMVLSLFNFKSYYPETNTLIKSIISITGEMFMVVASLLISYLFLPSKHKNTDPKKSTLQLSLLEIKIIFIFGLINTFKYAAKYSPLSIKFKNPFKKGENTKIDGNASAIVQLNNERDLIIARNNVKMQQ